MGTQVVLYSKQNLRTWRALLISTPMSFEPVITPQKFQSGIFIIADIVADMDFVKDQCGSLCNDLD